MNRLSVEVAVGFTDNTWENVMTEVEDFPSEKAESAAEEKVLEDYYNHPTKTVAFTKAIWVTSHSEDLP